MECAWAFFSLRRNYEQVRVFDVSDKTEAVGWLPKWLPEKWTRRFEYAIISRI